MDSVQGEVVPPPRENARTGEDRIDAVADKAAERVKRVIHALIDRPGNDHPFWGLALDAVSPILERRLKSYIRQTIVDQLQSAGQM
jgi:hypothetical protein